jgi:hypothetical protein
MLKEKNLKQLNPEHNKNGYVRRRKKEKLPKKTRITKI